MFLKWYFNGRTVFNYCLMAFNGFLMVFSGRFFGPLIVGSRASSRICERSGTSRNSPPIWSVHSNVAEAAARISSEIVRRWLARCDFLLTTSKETILWRRVTVLQASSIIERNLSSSSSKRAFIVVLAIFNSLCRLLVFHPNENIPRRLPNFSW